MREAGRNQWLQAFTGSERFNARGYPEGTIPDYNEMSMERSKIARDMKGKPSAIFKSIGFRRIEAYTREGGGGRRKIGRGLHPAARDMRKKAGLNRNNLT